MQIGAATVEKSMKLSQKSNNRVTIGTSKSTLEYISKKGKNANEER